MKCLPLEAIYELRERNYWPYSFKLNCDLIKMCVKCMYISPQSNNLYYTCAAWHTRLLLCFFFCFLFDDYYLARSLLCKEHIGKKYKKHSSFKCIEIDRKWATNILLFSIYVMYGLRFNLYIYLNVRNFNVDAI